MPATKKRIFFSAGEPSGDLHAANLIKSLRAVDPDVEIVGLGGPEMQQAGCRLLADLTALAVMWFLRALLNIHKFYALAQQVDRYFRDEKPDAVILVDFPGFNWHIAKRAKRRGIPVFYYCPPQIWAWASWRVKKMRRNVDHVLCCLPFEQDWFTEHGCNATFIGHPFFEEVKTQQVDQAFIDQQQQKPGRVIAILPGSRTQEVTSNFSDFLKTAQQINRKCPDTRFVVAAFKPHHVEICDQKIAELDYVSGGTFPIEVHLRKTPELIRLAHSCMSVSGSVSLELLANRRPTVILYKISWYAMHVQSWFRRVKYITLVNLLSTGELYPDDTTLYEPNQPDADRVLFPEYLTSDDRTGQIAAHITEWLTDDAAYQQRIDQLDALCEEIGHGGAPRRAAEYILSNCQETIS